MVRKGLKLTTTLMRKKSDAQKKKKVDERSRENEGVYQRDDISENINKSKRLTAQQSLTSISHDEGYFKEPGIDENEENFPSSPLIVEEKDSSIITEAGGVKKKKGKKDKKGEGNKGKGKKKGKKGKGKKGKKGKKEHVSSVKTSISTLMLSDASFFNLQYIAHDVSHVMELRGFEWPGTKSKKKKGKGKGKKQKK